MTANYPHADDVLVMCENCGSDTLQSEAHYHESDDGAVPLCCHCHKIANMCRDYNPND